MDTNLKQYNNCFYNSYDTHYFSTINSTNKWICKNSIPKRFPKQPPSATILSNRQTNFNLGQCVSQCKAGWWNTVYWSYEAKTVCQYECVCERAHHSLCSSVHRIHLYTPPAMSKQPCHQTTSKIYTHVVSDAQRNLHSFIYLDMNALKKTNTMERGQIRTVMLSNPLVLQSLQLKRWVVEKYTMSETFGIKACLHNYTSVSFKCSAVKLWPNVLVCFRIP